MCSFLSLLRLCANLFIVFSLCGNFFLVFSVCANFLCVFKLCANLFSVFRLQVSLWCDSFFFLQDFADGAIEWLALESWIISGDTWWQRGNCRCWPERTRVAGKIMYITDVKVYFYLPFEVDVPGLLGCSQKWEFKKAKLRRLVQTRLLIASHSAKNIFRE